MGQGGWEKSEENERDLPLDMLCAQQPRRLTKLQKRLTGQDETQEAFPLFRRRQAGAQEAQPAVAVDG